MKKILYLASGAVLALASCSDDFAPQGSQNVVDEGNYPITAQFYFGAGEDQDETRTTLNSSYQYLWNFGDQIGVLGSVSGLNVSNAPFVNMTKSTQNGNFEGNVNLLAGEGYYAYYPWTTTDNLGITYQDDEIQLESFVISNSVVQNFDTKSYENTTWSTQRATGSFGPNAAPAIAYATASGNNTINFRFTPLGAYLVFPITSTENIYVNSIALNISGGTYGENSNLQALVQDCEITIPDGGTKPGYDWTGEPSKSLGTNADTDAATITLLCSGNGVALGPNIDPVNFWFVVPPGITLRNNTITLTISATVNGESMEFVNTRAIDSTWEGTDSGETEYNTVTWLWQSTNHPFTVNTDDSYVITTPAQFLEYAFLVTQGLNTVYNTYWKSLTNYSLTDLPSMLMSSDQETNPYNGDLKSFATSPGLTELEVKPAIISGSLDLSPTAVQKWLAANNMTNVAKQGEYYKNVYANYAFNGTGLAPIGGKEPFTMGGTKKSPATITGLESNGTIFATITEEEYEQQIQYLTLEGCTASCNSTIGSTYTPFLTANPQGYNIYSNVIVGNNGVGNLLSSGTSNKIGVFTNLDNSTLSSWIGIENQGFNYLANVLNISQSTTPTSASSYLIGGYAFDFTKIKGGAFANYNTVKYGNYTQATQVGQSLFIVSGQTEAILLMDKFVNSNITYSVMDMVNGEPGTSYWTGYVNTGTQNGIYTAEYLANLLRSGADANFSMNVNLNLMGQYTKSNGQPGSRSWYVSNNMNPYTLNLYATTNQNTGTTWNKIENVYINSSNVPTNQKQSQILTVLGGKSYVPNPVYLSDITIDVEDDGCFVAAVSVSPGTAPTGATIKTSNVIVNNLSVNVEQGVTLASGIYSGAVGGLYQNINLSSIGNVGSKSSYLNGHISSGVTAGVLAGVFNFNLTTATQLTIPYVGPTNAFGIVNVNVLAQPGASSFMKVLKANAASTDNWMNWNYYGLNSDGSTGTPSSGTGVVTMEPGYTLYVNNATSQYLKKSVYKPIFDYETSKIEYQLVFPSDVDWSNVNPQVTPPDGYVNRL